MLSSRHRVIMLSVNQRTPTQKNIICLTKITALNLIQFNSLQILILTNYFHCHY